MADYCAHGFRKYEVGPKNTFQGNCPICPPSNQLELFEGYYDETILEMWR